MTAQSVARLLPGREAGLEAGLEAYLARRPILIALAGPNGAGKSTFYESQLADLGLRFVNADILALTASIEAYQAALVADQVRRQLLAHQESFIFETVLSDPVGEKIAFMQSAVDAGFAVLLIFIGIDGPERSDQRVAMRVSQGGHDVPQDKLFERYPRILKNLKRALNVLPYVLVYDNSNLDAPNRLVASRLDGAQTILYRPVPPWLQMALS